MMHRGSRGFTLIELVFAMGLGIAVLAVGYRLYGTTLKMDNVEARRESMNLSVQNAMASIKRDIRGASSVTANGGTLSVDGGRVAYRNVASGLTRKSGRANRIYPGVRAEFSNQPGGRGVNVRLRSEARVHKRPLCIEVETYVEPRNANGR